MGWEPEEGEIPAVAAVAGRRTGWHSRGQAALAEAPCDTTSSSGKPVETMELDATISMDSTAAIAVRFYSCSVPVHSCLHWFVLVAVGLHCSY